MTKIELRDESVYPDDVVLKSVLGNSFLAFSRLLKLYDAQGMEYGWRYYHDGKAWLCKVQKKNKTIVWMSAWTGCIKATVYFPEKYISDIFSLAISSQMIEKIRNTKNVGKSKPCIFEIRDDKILDDFEKVMLLKLVSK